MIRLEHLTTAGTPHPAAPAVPLARVGGGQPLRAGREDARPPRRSGAVPRGAGAIVAAIALAALAGCADKAVEPEQSAGVGVVTEVTNPPGGGAGFEGAASDVTTDTCVREGDAWAVGGTVANSADGPSSYRIYVSILAGQDTRGLVEVQVPAIEPGAASPWSARVPVAEDGLRCVLRVERYPGDGASGANPGGGPTPVPTAAPGETGAPATDEPAGNGEDGQ